MNQSSTSNQNKKRSRWGQSQASASANANANASTKSVNVSEEEALQALQREAAEREHEKEKEFAARKRNKSNHSQESGDRKRGHWDRNDSNKKEGGHYGPASVEDDQGPAQLNQAASTTNDNNGDEQPQQPTELPNFGLSGALAKDTSSGGNRLYKGVLLKFQEPPEARAPNTQWRLYVFKGDEQVQTLHIAKQSAYLVGRNEEICDIAVQHPSCSSQHAVLQYRALPHKDTGKLNCQPYLLDLESTNGTFLNGVRLDAARYYQLKKGDVLKFGASTREYVLLTPNTTSIE